MTCLLNEEIRAIQSTLVFVNRGIALENNPSKKEELKQAKKELSELLNKKLGANTNYEY